MTTPVVSKVVCYVTCGDELLVFTHVDYPMEVTGVQVPAGTLRHGENPLDAAVRELGEETGIVCSAEPTLLGTQEYDMRPSKNEIQFRHYYHFVYDGKMVDSWFTQEEHDGLLPPTKLRCFWIPLEDGHVLSAGRGALLSLI